MTCTRNDSCCWCFEDLPTAGCWDDNACGCKIVSHDAHNLPLGEIIRQSKQPVVTESLILRAAAEIIERRGNDKFLSRVLGKVLRKQSELPNGV